MMKFTDLREFILSAGAFDIKTLQRFAGNCISMYSAIPAAKLYCREVHDAISFCMKNSKAIPVSGVLRDEIKF